MKLRKFKKQDAKRCSEIIYSCLDFADKMSCKDKLFLRNFYVPENIIGLAKKSDFYVVEKNKKIIGMGRLEKNKISTIYFDLKFHRKKGGSLIIKKLEEVAKKNKINKIHLDSLLQSVGFYDKLGFKKIKKLKKPVLSYLMLKEI